MNELQQHIIGLTDPDLSTGSQISHVAIGWLHVIKTEQFVSVSCV
jgi:hypothetical protein